MFAAVRQARPPRRVAGHANEGLKCLMSIQEQFRDLRNDALDFVRFSRLSESSPNHEGRAGSQDWEQLCITLHRWFQAIERMLEKCRVDYAILWEIWRGLPSVKEQWLHWRSLDLKTVSPNERYDDEPGNNPRRSLREEILREEARFDELLGNVKALLASLGQS